MIKLHRAFWLAALLVVLIAGAAVVWFSQNQPTMDSKTNALSAQVLLDSASLAESSALQPDRSSYGIPSTVFSNLPPLPSDLGLVVQLLQENRLRFDMVPERYYLQPEFFPQFEERAIHFWKNPDPARWFREGYGFYPSDETISMRRGETKTVVTFLHTAFGVQTYQGVQLIQSAPPEAMQSISVAVSQPARLLEPSYPKFGKGWVQKISIEVSATDSATIGSHAISLDVMAPPQQDSRNWSDRFGAYYADPGTLSIGRPAYQLTVRVVE